MNEMLNTHGLKMIGLKEAADETSCIRENSGHCVQISYDKSTGEVITHFFADENGIMYYCDPDVYRICFAGGKMSEQDIADRIAESLSH